MPANPLTELKNYLISELKMPEHADIHEFALQTIMTHAAILKSHQTRTQAMFASAGNQVLIASDGLQSAARDIEHHLRYLHTLRTALAMMEHAALLTT